MEIASLTIVSGLTFGNLMVGTLAIIGIMSIAIFVAMKLINYAKESLIKTDTRKLNEKELRRVAREEMKNTFATREKALKEKQTKIQSAAQAIVEATNSELPAINEETEELFGV